MKYLWLGSYLDEKTYKEMRDIGYKNPAAYQSQTNILEGLESVLKIRFDTIGILSMEGYPADKTLSVKRKEFTHAPGSKDVMVGFGNILYLNRFLGKQAICREAKRWAAEQSKSETVHVFVYEMRSSCLAAAAEVKKRLPLSKIHLIVPDLPQFMDLSMNALKKKLKQLDWNNIKKNCAYVDDYILYASPMAEKLGLRDKQWMLMEGAINLKEIGESFGPADQGNKTVVMYSGATQLGFGMERLLQAFSGLSDHFELWITGSGDAQALIKEYAAKNSRIKYFGFLDTREELKKLQQKATALINMRDPQAPASNYCFPSKLFEYIYTGKPVLSFKMGGIPQEYYDYLLLMDEFTPEGIRAAIERLGSMSKEELTEIGERGRRFIKEKKVNTVQSERIAEFTGLQAEAKK